MQVDPEEQLLSTGDVAEIYGVTANTVLRWCKEGLIDSIQTIGGHYRIPRSAVLKFSESRFGPKDDSAKDLM